MQRTPVCLARTPAGRLLLVDVNGVLHRSFHAFSTVKGIVRDGEVIAFPNGGLRGVATALLGMIQHLRPTHVACCQDGGTGRQNLWRSKLVEDYKGSRGPTKDGIKEQLRMVPALCEALGCAHMFAPGGEEADDLLGSFRDLGVRSGLAVSVLAFDKDLLQLVSDADHVEVVRTGGKGGKPVRLGDAEVREALGVPPASVPQLFALAGDGCDNFFGVPGVGPKRGIQLLEWFGTAKGAVEGARKGDKRIPKGVTASLLDADVDSALAVAQINRNIPGLPFIEQLRYSGPPDPDYLRSYLIEQRMPALAKRIHVLENLDVAPPKKKAARKKSTDGDAAAKPKAARGSKKKGAAAQSAPAGGDSVFDAQGRVVIDPEAAPSPLGQPDSCSAALGVQFAAVTVPAPGRLAAASA